MAAPSSTGLSARDIAASIRHGFSNLGNFSDRDSRRNFWPFVALLLALYGAAVCIAIIPGASETYLRSLGAAGVHPETAVKIGGEVLGARIADDQRPNFQRQTWALWAITAIYLILVAAALARRRHDRDFVEAAAVLALPAVAAGAAAAPFVALILLLVPHVGGPLYALIRGGAPERIVAGTFVAGPILFTAVAGYPTVDPMAMAPSLLVADGLTFLICLLVAVRADRMWPIWTAASMGLIVTVRIAELVDPDRIPWADVTASLFLGLPMYVALIAGTRAHRLRLKRDGADRAWTPRPPSGR